MKLLLIGVSLSLLAACTTLPAAQTVALQQQAQATIPHCTSAHQCEGEWAAARDWVTSSCAMKIQTFSDSYIATYNATDGEPGLACQVTKTPIPAGGYTIDIAVSCDNIFGCVPNQWAAIVAFNKAVNDAGAQFTSASPAVAAGVR